MKTRTMVCLEPDQHRALGALARAEGTSLPELIRRIIRVHITGRPQLPAVDRAAYSGLVALGASGRHDIGDAHDTDLAALRKKHARS